MEPEIPHYQKILLFMIVGLVALNMCCRSDQQKVTGPEAAVQTTTYHSKGVVKSTNAARPSIEIDHEDIPGLMPAMTMEFYVRDKSMLDGLKSGDRVEFTLENGVGGIKITAIKRV